MEQLTNLLEVSYTNSEINSLIAATSENKSVYTRHFNQAEEFFLKLPALFTVPHFPVHHNILKKEPDSAYLNNLTFIISQLMEVAPEVFAGLTYWFDAEDIHRPVFFKLYRHEPDLFLYLLKVDLTFRHAAHEVIEKGDNDTTPYYRTRQLFLEAQLIPVTQVIQKAGGASGFVINQVISQTWIGERGRGYFVQGIWMDDDLSKFFSKLFVPPKVRIYPYYPYTCKYKTICRNVITLAPQFRAKGLDNFLKVIDFLSPHLTDIQNDLRESSFSDGLTHFRSLKPEVPGALCSEWKNVAVRVYLNEQGMREFIVED
jgi:hypothetical protein